MPVTIVGNNTPTAGGVVYGDGTNYVSTSAGTAGQVLLSNGASAPSFGAVPTVNLATGVTGTLPVANGGTGATSLTANNVLLGNGTSAVQVVAPGTNGNVLTSNGTTWTSAAASTGALVLISTTTVSGPATTVDISGSFSSTYDDYCILIDNLVYNSSDSFDIRTAYGGSFRTTNYLQQYSTFSNVSSVSRGVGQDRIYVSSLYAPYPSFVNAQIWIMNRNSTNYKTSVIFQVYGLDGSSPYSGMYTVIGSGNCNLDTTALTGIRFFASSNSIQTGTFRLYGVAK
jgi:hypothetical protein